MDVDLHPVVAAECPRPTCSWQKRWIVLMRRSHTSFRCMESFEGTCDWMTKSSMKSRRWSKLHFYILCTSRWFAYSRYHCDESPACGQHSLVLGSVIGLLWADVGACACGHLHYIAISPKQILKFYFLIVFASSYRVICWLVGWRLLSKLAKTLSLFILVWFKYKRSNTCPN